MRSLWPSPCGSTGARARDGRPILSTHLAQILPHHRRAEGREVRAARFAIAERAGPWIITLCASETHARKENHFMTGLNAGRAVIELLRAEQVRYVFGIVGG